MTNHSVACIAFRSGRILIAHRNPTGDMGDRWEFPGGKVEDGETAAQAVCREMNEEFGITVRVGAPITKGTFCHHGKQCTLTAYAITVPHDGSTTPYTLTEHTEYCWTDPEKIPSLL